MNKIKVLFQNVNGLPDWKLQIYKNLLDEDIYHLIIIQEHWFQLEINWENDPYILHTSTMPPRKNRRINGGIATLVHPSNQYLYSPLFTSLHSISFQFANLSFSTSYFPPSMSNEIILSELNSLPQSEFILGDFNFRMGKINADDEPQRNQRWRMIESFCNGKGLRWLTPTYDSELLLNPNPNFSSRTDHIFSKPTLNSNAQVLLNEQFKLKSDHNLLSLFIDSPDQNLNLNHRKIKYDFRMKIKLLRNENKGESFLNNFNYNFNDLNLNELISKYQSRIQEFNGVSLVESHPIIQDLLNDLQDNLVECLWHAGNNSIGSYPIKGFNRKRDEHVEAIDTEDLGLNETLTLFKSLHRGQQIDIIPSHEHGNVFKECSDFYNSLWNESNEQDLGLNEQDEESFQFIQGNHFSKTTLQNIINKYPSSKGCGPDGIHIVILKTLVEDESFISYLLNLFNLYYSCQITPTSFNHAQTTLLVKDKEQPTPSKLRPISITSIFRRIYEKLLISQWSHENLPWFQLHPTQAGCRRGFSAPTQILINDELSKRGYFYSAVLDIAKAYDNVNHYKLKEILRKRNTPSFIFNILNNLFFKDLSTQLIVNGLKQPPIQITRGIFQGSPLSPLLFEIFFDSLCYLLNPPELSTESLPNALFFVDDLIIKSKSAHDLDNLLALCDIWSSENLLKFNVQKSYVVIPPQELKNNLNLSLQSLNLEQVKQGIYLGTPITYKGTLWFSLLKNQIESANKCLKFLFATATKFTPYIKMLLTKTFVLSQFNYCGGILGLNLELKQLTTSNDSSLNEILQSLSDLDDQILLFIFNTRTTFSENVLRYMTLMPQIQDYLLYLRETFQVTIHKLDPSNPWNQMIAPSGSILSTGNLLQRISTPTPVYKRYLAIKESSTGHYMSFKDHLKSIYKNSLKGRDGILHHYVLEKSRNGPLNPDNLLKLKNDVLRSSLIDWRRNLCLPRRICINHECHENFNRKHLTECDYHTILPPDYLNEAALEIFIQEESELRLTAEIEGWNYQGNYTIMDSMINNGLHELAGRWLCWLEENLIGTAAQHRCQCDPMRLEMVV